SLPFYGQSHTIILPNEIRLANCQSVYQSRRLNSFIFLYSVLLEIPSWAATSLMVDDLARAIMMVSFSISFSLATRLVSKGEEDSLKPPSRWICSFWISF